MTINGLIIPDALVAALERRLFRRSFGGWRVRSDQDAFGNFWEGDIGEVYETQQQIEKQTAKLPKDFQPDAYYGESLPEVAGPAAIPDILDFSKIICFAMGGEAEPFCLDYRDSPDRPRVIYWDDTYWRVVAPDFESFLALFDLENRK